MGSSIDARLLILPNSRFRPASTLHGNHQRYRCGFDGFIEVRGLWNAVVLNYEIAGV
jgi:hypothetical protein